MRMIDYQYLHLTDGFWKRKQKNNSEITTKAILNRFIETGRIAAFDFTWKNGMENKPHIFWDSDVAKWMEAVAYILHYEHAPELEQMLEALIDRIESNQGEDGYFNIYYTVCEPDGRFRNRTNHELYCAGHLIEAAVAYYESTGRARFLNCMRKYADYIYKIFVIEKSAGFYTPGHEEIELALIRLYKCTGETEYLELAQYFIDSRGKQIETSYDYALPEYAQSHLPVREQRYAVGHAVRACYLYTGMAKLAKETRDQELGAACKSIFFDIVKKKMYITGGIGSTHIGEAFTVAYDLPNDKAYNETCASIGMCLFARAMQELDNDTVYADIIEKEIYNGVLTGISLDSKSFFYENPLEINMRNYVKNAATITKERYPITSRKALFETSCCPPNINRTIASIQSYIFGIDGDKVYLHQYMSCEMDLKDKHIKIETNYPRDGVIRISCESIQELWIRIPIWCDEFSLDCSYEVQKRYIVIAQPKELTLEFVMKPVFLEANPLIFGNNGKVALQYGPIVYCIESIDNCENLYSLFVNPNTEASVEYNETYCLNTLKIRGWQKADSDSLYYPISNQFVKRDIYFIPYSCRANRGDTNMLVWVNLKQ